MTDTDLLSDLLIVLIGGCIGFVLSVPLTWGIFKWIKYRDMTRVDRLMRKYEKTKGKR
jgi:hypothetical protein